MQGQPLLSVVVPVYNAGKFLPRCLDSLMKQTYQNLEIILIDDGSTDDSPKICDMYAQESENIRVLHKENGGAGYARNSGLDMANGEYIAFLDADDYIDETMYARLMSEVEKEKPDAVFCDFSVVRANGSIEAVESDVPAGRLSGKELLLSMLGATPEAARDSAFDVSLWKSVYSRRLIEEFGIRFSSERNVLSEDLFFHIDFLPHARSIIYIKDKLHYYCEVDGSLTHRYMDGRLDQEKNLFQTVCRRTADILQGDEMLRWERMFLGRVRSTIGQYVYYANGYSFSERIGAIRKIANDELVCSVICSYPINRNPLKLRIFNTFLKWRFCTGMYLLLVLNR